MSLVVVCEKRVTEIQLGSVLVPLVGAAGRAVPALAGVGAAGQHVPARVGGGLPGAGRYQGELQERVRAMRTRRLPGLCPGAEGFMGSWISAGSRLLVGLINLILDPLLMFTFKLNMAGAAMATAAAQWIGAFSYAIKVGGPLCHRPPGIST
jgi:hypothetical protein